MKTRNLLSAALVALGIVAQVKADPIIYLTGSTAFRSTAMSSILNNTGTNNGGVFDSGTVTYTTYGNAVAGSANYAVVHGNIAGSSVYLDVAWSGSEAGIASACNSALTNEDRNGTAIPLSGSPETWLNVSNVTLSSGGIIVSTNPAANSGLFEGASRGADLSQADTSQAISWTPSVTGTQTQLKDFGVEAIVTFTLTRNAQPNPSNEWTHCSNITLPQLNVLFSSGFVPAGFISGNPTDDDFAVYLVGRNLGSGTRMNMLGDSAYGAHKKVQQYSIGFGIEETPHQQLLVLTNEGNGGYESGGDVAKALGITNGLAGSCQQPDPFNGGVGWFAVGYLGPSDALNSANFGGEPTNDWMTVDGVLSSNGAIENGSWWYWGHEHLYGKFGISGVQQTVGNLLFGGIQKNIALQGLGSNPAAHDSAIQNGLMVASKASDVAFPTP